MGLGRRNGTLGPTKDLRPAKREFAITSLSQEIGANWLIVAAGGPLAGVG